ncbi:MAG: hypothetical protein WD851_24075 [Pirellulales bacterium]
MFDPLESHAHNADRMLEALARELAAAGRWHDLFQTRLVQQRARLGLAADSSVPLEEVEEPLRSQLEGAYTAACREVGELLLESGQFREAWYYLRPAGEKARLHRALAKVVPADDQVEGLIELALYEGVDVERGYGWLLGRYGTCNAITTLEGLGAQLPPSDLRACAAALVRHLHQELLHNVAGHIERVESERNEPKGGTTSGSLVELFPGREWLFEHEAAHVDASHLSAAVRFARVLEERQVVRLAWELAEYGRRLHATLQYPGEAPFVDHYPSHALLFAATLGNRVEEAIEFFTAQAAAANPEQDGTAAVETLLVLLTRTGRWSEALTAYRERVPAGVQLSPFAPRLLDLAQRSGEWDAYAQIMRERNDPVGFAIGQLAAQSDR